MSRLEIFTPDRATLVIEDLYRTLDKRIEASPPGLCPVDITRAFIEMCHAQTCGKCVPCRVGLLHLKHMMTTVLNGTATMDNLLHNLHRSLLLSRPHNLHLSLVIRFSLLSRLLLVSQVQVVADRLSIR